MVKTGDVCSVTLGNMPESTHSRPTLGADRLKAMGRSLLLARKRANLSQGDVAERIGVDYKTISRLENGTHPPQLPTLDALAELYGCGLDDLMPRETTLGNAASFSPPTISESTVGRPQSIEERVANLEIAASRAGHVDDALKSLLRLLGSAEELPDTLRDRVRAQFEAA